MKKYFLGIVYVTIGVFFLNSCNTKSNLECQTCKSNADKIFNLTFGGELGNHKTNAQIWKVKELGNNYDLVDLYSFENTTFSNITTALSANSQSLLNADKIAGYSIYYSGKFKDNDTIVLKSIIGFSAYTFENNKMYHYFYNRDIHGKFIENVALKSEVEGMSYNEIHTIVKLLYGINQPISSIVFTNSKFKGLDENLNSPKNELDIKLKELKAIMNANSSSLQEDPGACGTPCMPRNNRKCLRRFDGYYDCGGTFDDCLVGNIYDTIYVSGTWDNYDSLDNSIQFSNLYTFRDSILKKSTFGQKYITLYYDLSNDFYNKANLSMALNSARILFEIYGKINILKNQNTNVNSILIDDNFANQVSSLLQTYRSKTTNPVTVSKIDEILGDLAFYQGKSVQTIRTLLAL